MDINRRNFLKFGAAVAVPLAVVGTGSLKGSARELPIRGGKDISPTRRKERTAKPTACWQCVTRCSMIGYVEDNRVVKLEGQPHSIRSRGKICAKGQAGVNQIYDPDRILYPMKHVGKTRGDGRWRRIPWNQALNELSAPMKRLRDSGHPEKFMFHYGRMKASSSKLIKSVFLATYGTKTIGNHTSICEGAKWTAQELTWGGHYDNWDFDNTRFVINFGSNIFETHTNHIPESQRLINAMNERNVKLITFDVRLSNTAARSTEWIPIKPGTDSAVALAMCNVIINRGLYDWDFLKFIKATERHDASAYDKVEALRTHLSKYTPQWAEGISGVSASKITSLAVEFANTKRAVVVSYRGAVAHYNGTETERAMQMLAAITGNIDNPGGRCKAVGASWKYPKGPRNKPKGKKLKLVDGARGQVAFPTHHVSHQVLKMIKNGSKGRPEIYMWYCYTPVYANGEVQENIDILKDKRLIPYNVCINPFFDESAALADLILPDATYLERWDWEDMVSPAQVPEYYIRQPLVSPLGQSKDFADVCCELAQKMGFPLGFRNKEDFVKKSCDKTPGVKEAGSFNYMKKHGVWHPQPANPKYFSYSTVILDPVKVPCRIGEYVYDSLEEPERICPHFGDNVLYDSQTGVYWNWRSSKERSEADARKKGYTRSKKSYMGYIGQKIGNRIYTGFKPDKVNKSGYLELYSLLLRNKRLSALPGYIPIPEHQSMGSNDLILTTYKVNVHIHSRSQNCKLLSEIHHNNPAWINPSTAQSRSIRDGDMIKIRSTIGEIETKAHVTEAIIPGVVAVSHHSGHWQYGRYASGQKAPEGRDDDQDIKLKWWGEAGVSSNPKRWSQYGVHPNWIIPNSPDPISGQQRWMDTVVTVTKA